MAASIIDTLRYARRLKEAGVAPAQAEAMADALAVELVPNLVTRADLARPDCRSPSSRRAWLPSKPA